MEKYIKLYRNIKGVGYVCMGILYYYEQEEFEGLVERFKNSYDYKLSF